MNVNHFQVALDYFGYSGTTLSNETCVVLHNSLILLQNENHFQQVYLWGQIYGVDSDYVVAYGYENDVLHGRVFYYSTNYVDWGIMPKATKMAKYLALISPNQFNGDPALVLDISMEGFENENEPINEGKKLKEEDRLAAVVSLINEEAAIIPRGALFKRPDGVIVENLAFSGLTYLEATHLKSYLHYRSPQDKWNTNLLTRPNYNFALDFLDTTETDIPKECWSLQFEMGCRLSVLRSLYWPGMTFYHCINTPDHGFIYLGDGHRNIDLPFML